MHTSIGPNTAEIVGTEAKKRITIKDYSVMDCCLSWIAQLVRAITQKAKDPGSSPGPR